MNIIPILDLKREIAEIRPEIDKAIGDVIDSAAFINGPSVKNFEQNLAEYLGVKHAIGCNSGTDALLIALRAAGVGPGDEVITSPFSFYATSEVIDQVGAKPVFVDVLEDGNIDPQKVEDAVTDKTRAIIPVHIFGKPCRLDDVLSIAKRHSLKVIEDTAQGFGGRCADKLLGTRGEFGAYSFFPSKNLGGFGDGGAVVTDDDDAADFCRALRSHGSRKKYFNEYLGYNSRLDSIQAAVLDVKLKKVDGWNKARRSAADQYRSLLGDHAKIGLIADDAGQAYHQFTVKIPSRDQVQESLKKEFGISTMIYYPVPLHKLPVYKDSHASDSHPVAERLSDAVLSLPIGPYITKEEIDLVAASLIKIVDSL